ncbi:MAG: hypothetical protein WED04_10110 [Promethearchaeati archaeon SRVP18_Atabeyarchaeia-1]
MRNLGVVWIATAVLVALLSTISLTTMYSGLVVYPDNWITSSFSIVATFLAWIRNGLQFSPFLLASVISNIIKLFALLALMNTAYTMARKTDIEFLRDAAPMAGVMILAGLVGAIAFLFFGAGIGRIVMESMDSYPSPTQSKSSGKTG